MLTVQSHVFSIFVIARRSTSSEADAGNANYGDAEAMRLAEEKGDALVRVVRSVVWRHKVGDDMVVTPLVRWEVLDYVPYEVLDLPEDQKR